MTSLRAWFDSRSLRERRLLLVMAALAVLTVLWAGIIRPVGDGLSNARERHASAVTRLAETEARVETLRDLQRRRPTPLTGSLADNVRARAADAGFALASVDEDGPNRVRIGIQSAKPAALTAWAARLENAGILIDSLAMTDKGDRTVSVTATLKARGAMRRIRLKTGPAALFGAMLAIALLLFLPMRIALDAFGLGENGLTARAVSGSVWSGRLREARFGDIALGDLRASVSPLALLVGRGRVSLSGAGIDGAVNVSRHGLGVADMTARVATGRVFSPLPVSALDLDSLTVRFRDGQCEAAEGRVRATLSGDAGGVALPQALSGAARCDGAALLLPLVSQAGTEGVNLRVTGNGRYTGELMLQPTDPAAAEKLALMGFVQNGSSYRLSIEGSF